MVLADREHRPAQQRTVPVRSQWSTGCPVEEGSMDLESAYAEISVLVACPAPASGSAFRFSAGMPPLALGLSEVGKAAGLANIGWPTQGSILGFPFAFAVAPVPLERGSA